MSKQKIMSMDSAPRNHHSGQLCHPTCFLIFGNGIGLAYYDECRDFSDFPWIDPCSGEQLNRHYDDLKGWLPLPEYEYEDE